MLKNNSFNFFLFMSMHTFILCIIVNGSIKYLIKLHRLICGPSPFNPLNPKINTVYTYFKPNISIKFQYWPTCKLTLQIKGITGVVFSMRTKCPLASSGKSQKTHNSLIINPHRHHEQPFGDFKAGRNDDISSWG